MHVLSHTTHSRLSVATASLYSPIINHKSKVCGSQAKRFCLALSLQSRDRWEWERKISLKRRNALEIYTSFFSGQVCFPQVTKYLDQVCNSYTFQQVSEYILHYVTRLQILHHVVNLDVGREIRKLPSKARTYVHTRNSNCRLQKWNHSSRHCNIDWTHGEISDRIANNISSKNNVCGFVW